MAFLSSRHAKLSVICLAFIAWGLLASGFSAQAQQQPKAVIEMFTSQGCSSCPPADKVLSNYAKNTDVLALSWHVDYWNYLGWKDTFSKAEFTRRQQLYAAAFNRRGVYTPQAVVNGRDHVVGSRKNDIKNMIDTYASSGKGLTVPIQAVHTGDKVRIYTAEGSASSEATLWMIYFDKEKVVKIKRGENRGRSITYHNVVRDMSMLSMAKSGKIDVTLSLNELKRRGHDACAVILQEASPSGVPGAIIGATVIGDFEG